MARFGQPEVMETTTNDTTPRGSTVAGPTATEAIAAVHAAAPGWRRTAPEERATALRRAAALVRGAHDLLGDQLHEETGRLREEAAESAGVAADLLEEAAANAVAPAGRVLAGAPGQTDLVRREPYGVVGVITPWNDPFPIAAGLIGAALATGNTVVHKPSERCSRAGATLAGLVASALPDDVLATVSGDGAVGAQIARDERVALVAHVGSTVAGRSIATTCAARGGAYVIENGGKDPVIVDAGVPAAWAAEQIAVGAFANAGQICTSVERVYIHQDVADDVIAELVARARALVPGVTLPRMVDEDQLEVVRAQVEDARSRGAEIAAGGHRLDLEGPWWAPTVLTGCSPEMAVMTEETFGPLAPIRVVPDWESGLREAGSSDYGLAATVLTDDPEHAAQAIAELDVGTVKVNDVFGGAPGGSADPRRASGRGRGFGPDLLDEMTLLKVIHQEQVNGPGAEG